MNFRFKSIHTGTAIAVLLIIMPALATHGCSTSESSSRKHIKFEEVLAEFPPTKEELKLTNLAITNIQDNRFAKYYSSGNAYIIVHPAYGAFFHKEKKRGYSSIKRDMMIAQFNNEMDFIKEHVSNGAMVILIVPAEYKSKIPHPESYTRYLNELADGKDNLFFIYSSDTSTGNISAENMVRLYEFLHSIEAQNVLLGGGYIGRCQKEFYEQFSQYFESGSVHIVPEISSISPDDISTKKALDVLDSLEEGDFKPVERFIKKELGRRANILSVSEIEGLRNEANR